jgi:prepilin-type N-terminal cleavage/methylation domain-containing protein
MMSAALQESVGFLPDRRFISKPHSAFTLLELLTVISIISIIIAITLPALNFVRRKSRIILGMNNQKQIVSAVNFYALDHEQHYPESVATIGDQEYWNWSEPMMLTGYRARSPSLHRSMSAYLRNYIENTELMFCPNAPRKYKYLQESWDAGDNWDNPDTSPVKDPVSGIYCFYWNYIGFLKDKNRLFRGPQGPQAGKSQSKLLVSDYFGYNHWRSRNSFSSCEQFQSAALTEGTLLSSDYWSSIGNDSSVFPEIKLNAGYTDGHVESYSSLNTIGMRVILIPKTSETYPDDISPGFFYLPKNALH